MGFLRSNEDRVEVDAIRDGLQPKSLFKVFSPRGPAHGEKTLNRLLGCTVLPGACTGAPDHP